MQYDVLVDALWQMIIMKHFVCRCNYPMDNEIMETTIPLKRKNAHKSKRGRKSKLPVRALIFP